MKTSTRSGIRTALFTAVLIALFAGLGAYPSSALLQSQRNIPAPTGYIQGVVQSEKGPEAGVWVIAETKDLLTNFIKIVVTDDQGKFMVPDLPTANYKVWVRGFGLVDSTPITMKPATNSITLKAATAKTPKEAAAVYPGNYWLAMLEPPAKTLFPGTGAQGNGLGAQMLTQNHWINQLKSGCNFCHQLGNQLTRSLDHVYKADPSVHTSVEAWDRRLKGGVRGNSMYGTLSTMGNPGTLKQLGLDRSHRQRRSAARAPKTERHRAQYRRDAVGCRRRSLVHARSSHDGQEPPHRQRRRSRLCRERRSRSAGGDGSKREQHVFNRHPDA